MLFLDLVKYRRVTPENDAFTWACSRDVLICFAGDTERGVKINFAE